MLVTQYILPLLGSRVAQAADDRRRVARDRVRLAFACSSIKASAIEHDHAGFIEITHQAQAPNRVAKNGPVLRLVQQPPYDDAGMIAISPNHFAHGAIKSFRHEWGWREHPARIRFLINH